MRSDEIAGDERSGAVMASTTSPVRARDDDRADVCGLIDAALADGQLSSDEHAARTAAAMKAEYFGELDKLTWDLQIPGAFADAPVVRGGVRRRTRWWIPVGVLLVAALLGMAAGCVGSAADKISGPPLPDLTTGAGQAYFLDRYRAEFGDTVADDFTIYPGYALFHRSTDNPLKSQYYHFDGDFDEFGSESARKPTTPTVDYGAVNLPVLARLLAGAVDTLKVPNGRISHMSLQLPSGSEPDAAPLVSIYVRNEAQDSGSMEIAFDGEVLEVSPLRK
ncbi:DUF1707 SHOCT-like domain-containing protein [Nocardia noduli]|uniref:DUF1707 SHOCT-like domain-containing protein n=1 Tax=Nocardia noduli TaxID=2815722 RepID=UPI001C23BB07|nr:DUF1707 domain-containing protein [Nocardia noduli]